MASKRCRPWVCSARRYSRMASRQPGPVQALVRGPLVRSGLPRLLALLQGHRGHLRITAALRWVPPDPGLAAVGLLFRPDRPLRRSEAAPQRRRLGALTPAPAVGLVRRPP